MSLRVLFVTTTYPLRTGDTIPGFVADLARSLVRHHEVQIKVIAPHHPGALKSETVDGIRIERFQYAIPATGQCLAYGSGIPDNLKNLTHAKWQVPGLFAGMAAAVFRNLDQTDLIHAHWVEPAFIASMANTFHRRPLVVSVHSLKPKASALHRRTLANADRVLFNSWYTLSESRRLGYRSRGEVIYQGYDDTLFGSRPRTKLWDIPPEALVVTAIGRMIEVKGLHVLAAAATKILESRSRVHLVIAGDGPERARIESIVAGNPHRSRIHFPGALSRTQVADLLARSDLFVNPGVIDQNGRAEGLGITTIEAMASGLAVVGSRVGGIVETIVDGSTGILVPPGDSNALADAVSELIDDPARRGRLGAAGHALAEERFSWRALSEQVMRVYNAVRRPSNP